MCNNLHTNTVKDIYSSLIISLKADTSVVFPASQPRGQSREGGKEKKNPNKINICEFLNRLDCITMLNVCDDNSGVGCVLCVWVYAVHFVQQEVKACCVAA